MHKLFYLFICIGFFSFAQKSTGTIHFNDGTSKLGLVSLKLHNNKIYYKSNKSAKREYYDIKIIKSISFYENSEFNNYVYLKDNTGSFFYKVILLNDNVSLYSITTQSNNFTTIGNGMSVNFSQGGKSTFYYVKRKNEKFVTKIGDTHVKKRIAKKYFNDCKWLMKQMKGIKIHKEMSVIEFVNVYNKCVN